jgi:hypothetical protein
MDSFSKIHHKMSSIEKQVNYIQIALVVLLVVLCAICSLGYSLVHFKDHLRDMGSYVPQTGFSPSVECIHFKN